MNEMKKLMHNRRILLRNTPIGEFPKPRVWHIKKENYFNVQSIAYDLDIIFLNSITDLPFSARPNEVKLEWPTGFLDYHGDAIYQGDIIRSIEKIYDSESYRRKEILKYWIAAITFEYGRWFMRNLNFSNGIPWGGDLHDGHEGIEIIGNINQVTDKSIIEKLKEKGIK